MVDELTRKFGINSTLVKRVSKSGTTGWRMRVRKRSMDSLIKLVNPIIIPELRYKIGKSKLLLTDSGKVMKNAL